MNINIDVPATQALFDKALAVAVDIKGMIEADARQTLTDDKGKIDIAACIMMIIYHGLLPQ